jgi:hypothetical protein
MIPRATTDLPPLGSKVAINRLLDMLRPLKKYLENYPGKITYHLIHPEGAK